MKQAKYLNVILTANAMLLGGLLWTQVASEAPLTRQAAAQTNRGTIRGSGGVYRETPNEFVPPNAAMQRKETRVAVENLKRSVDLLYQLLESGRLKVEVTNLDEIEVTVAPTD